MAPKGRVVRRSPRNSAAASASATSKPTRTRLSRKPKNREVSADSPSTPTTSTSSSNNVPGTDLPDRTGGCCSTPKARRFRIPPIDTCPPAPKKQRVASKNCSLQRRPIAFFAHPDIELFFNFAFRGIRIKPFALLGFGMLVGSMVSLSNLMNTISTFDSG